MSKELNSFEFFEGTRNPNQELYQKQFFNEHLGITWRCISKTSTPFLNINEEAKVVTKELTGHVGHSDLLAVE